MSVTRLELRTRLSPSGGGELYHDKTPTNNDTALDPCRCGSSPKPLFSNPGPLDNCHIMA